MLNIFTKSDLMHSYYILFKLWAVSKTCNKEAYKFWKFMEEEEY